MGKWDPRINPPPACPNESRQPQTSKPHEIREAGSLGLRIGTGYTCHGCWLRFRVTPAGVLVENWGPAAPSWMQDIAP